MLSGALIGFTALFAEVTGVAVSPRVYEVEVFIVVLYASYLAWRDEHQSRLMTQTTLTQLANREALDPNRPHLSGRVLSYCLESEDQDDEKGYEFYTVAFDIKVLNAGAPSLADNWTAKVTAPNISETLAPRDVSSESVIPQGGA